jgi:hypothetical protein
LVIFDQLIVFFSHQSQSVYDIVLRVKTPYLAFVVLNSYLLSTSLWSNDIVRPRVILQSINQVVSLQLPPGPQYVNICCNKYQLVANRSRTRYFLCFYWLPTVNGAITLKEREKEIPKKGKERKISFSQLV